MSAKKPNIIVILADDMGYSDLGCYGSEIQTPNIDKLADNGVRLSQFYTTPKCAPSRACLLTGLQPHQVGMAILPLAGMETAPDAPDGYVGDLSLNCLTIPEVLKTAGYQCYMAGKWHLSNNLDHEDHTWPRQRGFDHHYGILTGATSYFWPGTLVRDGQKIDNEAKNNPNYYLTDAISDQGAQYIREHNQTYGNETPFFLYMAYTCPHWPLHAKPEDIAKVKGRYNDGWDVLRKKRLDKLQQFGLLNSDVQLSPRDPDLPSWDEIPEEEKAWYCRRMEVYAAQIECLDQGIGRLMKTLDTLHLREDTLVVFMSDNGACHEEIREVILKHRLAIGVARLKTKNGEKITNGNNKSILPGAENTFQSVGKSWANLSNTPFRGHKNNTLEGGIATPLIMSYPNGIPKKGEIRNGISHLVDLMPTLLHYAQISYPEKYPNRTFPPLPGISLHGLISSIETWHHPVCYWEYEDNAAIRDGDLKLVKLPDRNWELFQMNIDRTELNPLQNTRNNEATQLKQEYYKWAQMIGVVPYKKILRIKVKNVIRQNLRKIQFWKK